jgi:cysteine desulfurase/selenocysteine lyase
MIADVTFERTVYQPPPARFEAGTGSIGDAVGLGAAIEFMNRVGIENIERHEHVLIRYALEQLAKVPGLHFIGSPAERAGVISFVLDCYDAPEVGAALNAYGIAVRAGHHCAQPILRRFGVEATVRPSFAVHNDYDDVDELTHALREISARKGL